MSKRFHFNKTEIVLKMLVTDILLTAFGLVVFAYFHHVRNETIHPVALIPGTASPSPSVPTPYDHPTNSPETFHGDPDQTPPAASPDVLEESEPVPEVSDQPAGTTMNEEMPDDPEKNAPQDYDDPYPNDLLNGTHSDLFSAEPILTDRSYRSRALSFTIDTISVDGITFFLADIWIRDIRSFRTAVASEFYKTNKVQAIEIYKKTDALLAISGDYFSYRKTNNIAVRNGMEWIRKEPIDSDILILYYDGTMEVAYSDDRPDLNAIYARNPYQIWCFGPVLIDNYELPRSYNTTVPGPNPRCAIGYYRPGHYCFLVADGRQKGYSKGMTMRGLSDVFLQLGCQYAFNLDGGATAVMLFNGDQYSHPKNGTARVVSDIIYVCEPE